MIVAVRRSSAGNCENPLVNENAFCNLLEFFSLSGRKKNNSYSFRNGNTETVAGTEATYMKKSPTHKFKASVHFLAHVRFHLVVHSNKNPPWQ